MNNTNLFIAGAILSVGSVIIFKSQWIKNFSVYALDKKQKITFLIKLLNKLSQNVNAEQKSGISINDTEKSASIMYERGGQMQIVHIPYCRRYVAKMSQFDAKLIREDKEPLDITQSPGVPYLVSGEDLGGTCIFITNLETGDSKSYTTAPLYAEELFE